VKYLFKNVAMKSKDKFEKIDRIIDEKIAKMQDIKIEETLYDKVFKEIDSFVFSELSPRQAEILSNDVHNLAIQAQIELLQELQKDTTNTNANFRLKLIVKINELENKYSK
jgi:hypothetical protein